MQGAGPAAGDQQAAPPPAPGPSGQPAAAPPPAASPLNGRGGGGHYARPQQPMAPHPSPFLPDQGQPFRPQGVPVMPPRPLPPPPQQFPHPPSQPTAAAGKVGLIASAPSASHPPEASTTLPAAAAEREVGTEGGGDGPSGPAGGAVSPEDIQTVQNLVERCLQLYMARDEVVNVLKTQATIDPGFTQLVWGKLEEQNPEFFRCYYTRLKLKAQIIMFNHLLEQQVAVVQRMQHGWSGGGAGPAAATRSGIPLFQGGPNGGGARDGGGGGHHHGPSSYHHSAGNDRMVPGGDPMLQAMQMPGGGLDGPGPSPLFGALPHIGSDNDLANLAGNLPTPEDLRFMPGASPMTAMGQAGGVPATLARNFSLSDLRSMDHDNNGDSHVPTFGLGDDSGVI